MFRNLVILLEREVAARRVQNQQILIELGSAWFSHRHGKDDFDALTALVKDQIQTAATKLNDALVDIEAHPEFICEAIKSLFVANFVLLGPFDKFI